jgi:hypothetical protein
MMRRVELIDLKLIVLNSTDARVGIGCATVTHRVVQDRSSQKSP